jgi:hypothetical protein
MPGIQKIALKAPAAGVMTFKGRCQQFSAPFIARTVASEPKPVVTKRRAPPSIFVKQAPRVTSASPSSSSTAGDKSLSDADKGYDLVRPSAQMRPYKMTEKHRRGRGHVTITRTAKVPKLLIAPRPVDKSCVRKASVLEELMAKEALERKAAAVNKQTLPKKQPVKH